MPCVPSPRSRPAAAGLVFALLAVGTPPLRAQTSHTDRPAPAPVLETLAPATLLPAPPSSTGTPRSCTVGALLADHPCVLDGDPGQALAPPGTSPLAAVHDELCERVALPEERPACRVLVHRETRACPTDRPLVDGQGAFLPSSAGCYGALRHAALAAQRVFVDSRPCCACLEESTLTTSELLSRRDGTGRTPAEPAPAGRTRCLVGLALGETPAVSRVCQESCAAALLVRPSPSSSSSGTNPSR